MSDTPNEDVRENPATTADPDDLVDKTHPFGPGGQKSDEAKERDADNPVADPDTINDADDLVDPTHPHGPGGQAR